MYLTRQEASKRVNAGKPVFATYWEGTQQRVEVKQIIRRTDSYYSLVLADGTITPSMAHDRIQFSTKFFSY